ncbi:hypothetical protein EGW08_010601, partial [Elysia chlorotica]
MSPPGPAPENPAPQVMWSQRTLPGLDIAVKGEGLNQDSSHNKAPGPASSTISTNCLLGGGPSEGVSTRSSIQPKIGAKFPTQSKDQSSLQVFGKGVNSSQNESHGPGEVLVEPVGKFPAIDTFSKWSWDCGRSSTLIDSFVERRDRDLFQSCREHLDAINQSTQLQQLISDEMRSQAELDRLVFDSLKAQTERLQKQVGIAGGDAERAWVKIAFQDLRKCVKDQAHAHRVYSETLKNQSSAIQQSLDSHRDLIEKTKQAPPTQAPGTFSAISSSSCSSAAAGMSFVQATCVFEGVRKPRLKLISELDYLSAQVGSLDHQIQEVQSLLSSIKHSQDTGQAQWGVQLKLE